MQYNRSRRERSDLHDPSRQKFEKNAFKRSKLNRDCDPFALIIKTQETRLFAQKFHFQSVKMARNSKNERLNAFFQIFVCLEKHS